MKHTDDQLSETLDAVAAILAAGYLRYRRSQRREVLLDATAEQSLHGHEVNGSEKGEPIGDFDSQAD
jgi:hypothetical protein